MNKRGRKSEDNLGNGDESKTLLDWGEDEVVNQGKPGDMNEGIQVMPVDIRHQNFKKKLSGYDPNEVNSFLEQVASDYEKIFMHKKMLEKQLSAARDKLTQFKQKEKDMNETMLSAQKYVSELKEKTKQEQAEMTTKIRSQAEEILKDARTQADEIIGKAKQEAMDIVTDGKVEYKKMKSQTEELEKHRDALKEKFKEAIGIIKRALNPNEK